MSTKKIEDSSTIEIMQGVSVEIKGTEIVAMGSLGSNKRTFNDSLIKVSKKDSSLVISPTKEKGLEKKASKAVISFKKELENDMLGVNQYFEKSMRVVFAHFPINVEVKADKIYINNIIGERFPRICNIVGSTKVDIKGLNIRIYGTSLDDVSQTAANIRLVCKIRNKDSRVFQDGLYYEIE